MSSSSSAGLAAFFAVVVAAAGLGTGTWPGAAAATSVDQGHSELAVIAGQSAAGQGGGTHISFGDLSFDPLRTPPGSAADYRTSGNGKGLRFVQFSGKVRSEWLADLSAFGVRPLQYYPDDTFLVWADEGASRAAEGLAHVRWQGQYRPDWKLEPGLGKRDGLIRNVGVHFFNDGDVPAVLAAITAQGARVLTHGPAQSDRTFFDAWVEVDADRLAALAALPQVVWLEFADPDPIFDDEMSSQIVARNYNAAFAPQIGYMPWLGALGFNGNGVTWSVIDSGVDLTHPDFTGRIVGGFTYPGCPAGNGLGDDPATGGHGTHVAGIIAGNGAAGFADPQGFLYGIGIAPAAGIFAQNPICAGGVSWPPTGGWQVLSKNALLGGAVGGNGSWTSGESGGTTYTAGARAWDQIVRDGNFDTPINEAFTMVFSAGNSGPNAGTLTAPKAAKNPIITGSSRNFRAGSINDLSGFSSRGPTQDGRFGVTVSAPGETIASARRVAGASQCATAIAGTNNHYALCSGTSMAAPQVSGAAVLLTQWWRTFNGSANPSPAMIKALLINGARDLTGVAATIPNPNEGWGRIDLPGSMGLDFTASEYVDQSEVLTAVGQVYEVTYGVPDPAQPLKVSLAWTDAAAATGANPTLVNNLDLQVITGGQTYRGNVFTNGVSVPGGSADTLNNVENVFVNNPGADVTIRVIATNLPGDGIPGNGNPTDQDFALVCRNCVQGAGFTLAAVPGARAICAPATAQYDLTLGSLLGFNEPITLEASGHPAGSSASFATNPVPTLPGSSQFVVGNTGAAAPGAYAITVTGTAAPSGNTSNVSVALLLATAVPAASALTTPANNATNVIVQPTLSWAGAAQAEDYLLEVASDAGFGSIVLSTVVTGTSFALTSPLNTNTSYWWRVRAANACGDGASSPVFRFTTQPAPGDCPAGATAVDVFSENFTGGLGGFATTGSVGTSTWALSAVRPSPLSGGNAVLAVDIATVSDQRLTSPTIALPAADLPLTLKFQNWRNIENNGAAACYDGGILEVSVNGGAFTQITGAALLNDPYRGPVDGGFSNPLAGLNAWCEPAPGRPYADTLVDLSPYAGSNVQLRWRLGTDTSVAREGWYVDDIRVQACTMGPSADLSVVLSDSPDPVNAGDPIAFTAQVANAGPATADAVVLDVSVDPAFAIGSAAGSGWSCAVASATEASCTRASLALGAAPPVVVQAIVDASTASGTYTSSAQVSASTGDGDPSNNLDEETTTVNGGAPDLIFANGFECAPGLPDCPVGPVVLFDEYTGRFVTSPDGGAGGAPISALQTALAMSGFGAGSQISANNWVADDFVVPAGGWSIQRVKLYSYQTGSTTTPTHNDLRLRIWSNDPNTGSLVFGDTTTNRLSSVTFTGVYRVTDTAATGTTRPVMEMVAEITPPLVLPAGTYWLGWAAGGTLASGPWAPPQTVTGQTTTGNGQQSIAGAAFAPFNDGGSITPQGFPLVLEGTQ